MDKDMKMQSINLNAWFGLKQALKDINIAIKPNAVTAIIGPSGCGKSTFIRILNRMHELIPNAKLTGQVLLDGEDIYAKDVDPVMIRRRVGMVFQKPNPFPTMSIYDNVAAGLKLTGAKKGRNLDEIVKASLERATLWDEVKG
jgi:phosphate transport system ATP-binding protein